MRTGDGSRGRLPGVALTVSSTMAYHLLVKERCLTGYREIERIRPLEHV